MKLIRIAGPVLFGVFLAPALTFTGASQSANSAGGQSASDAPKPATDQVGLKPQRSPKKSGPTTKSPPQADQEVFR